MEQRRKEYNWTILYMQMVLYMPMADVLKKIRQEIDYNVDEFKHIIESKPFKKIYAGLEMEAFSLSTVPKGYDKD